MRWPPCVAQAAVWCIRQDLWGIGCRAATTTTIRTARVAEPWFIDAEMPMLYGCPPLRTARSDAVTTVMQDWLNHRRRYVSRIHAI